MLLCVSFGLINQLWNYFEFFFFFWCKTYFVFELLKGKWLKILILGKLGLKLVFWKNISSHTYAFIFLIFDANELLNNVKTENMLLLDKVISLELDLFVARSTSSKLDQLLKILILGKLGFKTCVLEKHFISYSCIFISFFNALRCVFKNQVIFSKKYFSRFSIDPNCFSINWNLV